MTSESEDSGETEDGAPLSGIPPSAFMRELRPEYYSDTKAQTAYALTADVFEYRLETVTARNETHDFELFCRKLCERTICPNLRPQTGPEGGGDSKADTETYPVADEISSRYYAGEANSGRERWAFAFSAKKVWSDKVRKDVQGLIDTGRPYDRIFCVTSRFARAKDRARIEDELSTKHGVPVTIFDRSWIVKEIIENDRADLAVNYLNVGDASATEKLGPTDYSRARQLEDIERAISDPDAYKGIELQLVTEALLAAKLSRGLERPRTETDGRFERAIRVADKHGGFRQRLEARYERIWTAFWWHDDFELLNESYADFEARALESDNAMNLEFLGTLHQLLVNSVIHGHMTLEACQLQERAARLKVALEPLAQDLDRPNNALGARTALLRIRLNQAMMAHDQDALSAIWDEFADILEEAEGLGEYNAEGLVQFVEAIAQMAGNDRAYNALIEKLAEFVGKRKSEGEGALVLLRRAQKLDFSDHFDMIRWLGRAAVGLSKREYLGALVEAAQLLALAYRSADLHWASRASCLFAVGSLVVEGEADGEFSPEIVPSVKLWAWISVALGHLPDALSAVQLLNGFLAALPLDDESQDRVREDLLELDVALACLILNLEETELRRIEDVPDILEALELGIARTALLYALGYEDVLRADGSLPDDETNERVRETLSLLKSQPGATELPQTLVLNAGGKEVLTTTVLGMRIEIEIEGDDQIVIGEAVLGTLEAFFATAIELDIAPHAERFRIVVSWGDGPGQPSVETNLLDMTCAVIWPRDLPFPRYDTQRDTQSLLMEIAAQSLGATCFFRSSDDVLKAMFADEAVLQRIAMITAAPNSYNRVNSRAFACLSDWGEVVRRSYPVREGRVEVESVELGTHDDAHYSDEGDDLGSFLVRRHKGMVVRSVIDVHAWDRAIWRGCGYVQMGPGGPPGLMLLFENAEAARKIFERWRERFGDRDENEDLSVAILTELPGVHAHHYCVQIASSDPAFAAKSLGRPVQMATRSMVMEPASSANLDMFTSLFARFGFYCLMPAVVGGPELTDCEIESDLAIIKCKIVVKTASQVDQHDLEALALRAHRFT